MRDKGSSQGYVYFNKKRQTWQAEYIYYDVETGERKHKSKTFRNPEDAKKYLATFNYQRDNQLFIKNNGIPLIEFMRANLKLKYDTNQIQVAQFTRVSKTIDALEKIAFTKKKIDEIKTEEIQDYLNSLKHLSNSTIEKAHQQLNQTFKLAMDKGYLMQNPMVGVIRPRSMKDNKVVRALEVDEQQALTEYLKSVTTDQLRYKNCMLIELYMGLRVGEALALTCHDVDLHNKLLNVHRTITKDESGNPIMGKSTKTYAGKRVLPIPDFMIPVFIEQMKIANDNPKNEDKLLFTGTIAKYVNRENISSQLKRIMKNLCGVTDVSSHTLRHTFGTRCIESGMAPVVVQRLMGHTDIRVTLNTYTSVLNKFKESEIDKVNKYYLEQNLIGENPANNINLNEIPLLEDNIYSEKDKNDKDKTEEK